MNMNFGEGKILGINTDVFFCIVFLLLFVILGIVSFQYYAYASAGANNSAFSAGTGIGVSIFPNRNNEPRYVVAPQQVQPVYSQ